MIFSFAISPLCPAAEANNNGSFAAIYYSFKEDYIAWAAGWGTKKQAQKEALAQCRKESHGANDCKEALWFSEGCGSVAVGGKVVAWGWDDTAPGAIQAALARCAKDGGEHCTNKGSHCV